MIIAPLVFATLVVGIAKMGDIATVGRIGGKALGWFLFASLVSLTLGLILVQLLEPGKAMQLRDSGRRRRDRASRPARSRSRASSRTRSRPASSTRWRATRFCRSSCSRCSSAPRWPRSASAAKIVLEVLDVRLAHHAQGDGLRDALRAARRVRRAREHGREGRTRHHRRLRPVHGRVLSRHPDPVGRADVVSAALFIGPRVLRARSGACASP